MYSQGNLLWRWRQLGYCKDSTIGGAGCLLTCIAQLLTNHGIMINPGQLNKMLMYTNQYVDGCLIPDNAPAKLYPDKIKLIGRVVPMKPVDLSLLHRESGEEIILKIDGNPRTGVQRHFVIFKSADGGKVIIADPIGGWVGPFEKRYGDPRQNILAIIKYWFKEV